MYASATEKLFVAARCFMTAGWCFSWHGFDVGFETFPLGLGVGLLVVH